MICLANREAAARVGGRYPHPHADKQGIAMDTPCRAAMARTDITPDFDTELIGGWWPDPVARETLWPLTATALVTDQAGARCCLVSIDSLGLTAAKSDELRARLVERLHTAADQVMLTFTHTHEAPAPLSPVNGERYFALLCERVEAAAAEAAARLRPCKAAWALGRAAIGENRRDGCDTVDDRLAALRLTDAETGAPLGVILRLTAHANILQNGVEGRAVMSADYFGAARPALDGLFGAPVLYVQGAAGNVKPVGVPKARGASPAEAERVAALLVEAARGLAFGEPAALDPRMRSAALTLVSDVPTEAAADAIAADAQTYCGLTGAGWLAACARLRGQGIAEQRVTRELQAFFIAGGCLCGVPDELFCELSLSASALAGDPLLLLNGYTNGCDGYLPTAEEGQKGGFEPKWSYLAFYPFHGRVTAFRPGSGERIAALAARLYQQANTPASASAAPARGESDAANADQ